MAEETFTTQTAIRLINSATRCLVRLQAGPTKMAVRSNRAAVSSFKAVAKANSRQGPVQEGITSLVMTAAPVTSHSV